jgi:hypothetical protein
MLHSSCDSEVRSSCPGQTASVTAPRPGPEPARSPGAAAGPTVQRTVTVTVTAASKARGRLPGPFPRGPLACHDNPLAAVRPGRPGHWHAGARAAEPTGALPGSTCISVTGNVPRSESQPVVPRANHWHRDDSASPCRSSEACSPRPTVGLGPAGRPRARRPGRC